MSAPVAALLGLLAMAAGLAMGHLIGGFLSPSASPFIAVGSSAIDRTPTWLKDFAVRSFGSYDKLVLLLGMGAVVGLAGVVAGLLSRRSRTPGLVLIVLLGAVATAAVLSRPTAGAVDVLAPLAGLVVSAGTFIALHRLGVLSAPDGSVADGAAPAEAGGAPGVPRRTLLAGSAVVVAGTGMAAAAGQLLTDRGTVEASRRAVGRIVPTVAAPPIPAGADFVADGSPSFITPSRSFYRVDVNLTVPQLSTRDWRLRIHGMV
ncbi:MAG: molybdopterin-dependent oxidoreductase, partial [Pseudonocardiaceae bacterium]